MNKQLIKQKLKAFGWHFGVTLIIACLGAILIFGVWYPGQLAEYVGGTELYKLVLLVELGVGPLMSLVIYNPAKPKSELVRDYSVIGLIQLSALVYGLYAVAESRPAYIVFVKDRLEVVTAIDFDSEDFAEASDPYNQISWLGPRRVCVEYPTDPEERNELVFSAVSGKDIQLFPKYYRGCKSGELEAKVYPAQQLKSIAQLKSYNFVEGFPTGDFTWLPVKHRFGAWVEVYPEGDVSKGYFVDINPFE